MQNQSLLNKKNLTINIKLKQGSDKQGTRLKCKTEHYKKKHTLTTLNNIATLKTTKYYDEPLDHYSPATALNLIEVVPESNKH